MYVMNFEEREEEEVQVPGCIGVTMRWLVGRGTGAKTYGMRYFHVKPGGIIPVHTHPEEHEIFVLEGKAKLLGDLEGTIAKADDVIYIPSDAPHGYDNSEGTRHFRFICVIPLLNNQ